MKKTLKCGITAAVFVAAGIAAYQSYSSYGVQDNSLLMQNVEALASGPEAEAGMEEDMAPPITGLAKKWNYSAEYVVTGWKAGGEASVSATMRAAILKLFGKTCRPDGEIAASIEKYTVFQKRDIYQEKCLSVPGANCICDPADNNKWHYKPSTTPSWWGKSDDRCL